MMWSSRAPVRAHHVLQLNASSRFKQKKLSHLSGKAREQSTRLASKRLNYSDASSWTRRNRMWVEVLGNTSRTKCLSSSPAEPWEVSFHVKTIWLIWSAPYALILDHRGHLHFHRLCNNHERRDRIAHSYMNCEIWWVNRSSASV